jgi:hypothetical protein
MADVSQTFRQTRRDSRRIPTTPQIRGRFGRWRGIYRITKHGNTACSSSAVRGPSAGVLSSSSQASDSSHLLSPGARSSGPTGSSQHLRQEPSGARSSLTAIAMTSTRFSRPLGHASSSTRAGRFRHMARRRIASSRLASASASTISTSPTAPDLLPASVASTRPPAGRMSLSSMLTAGGRSPPSEGLRSLRRQ